MKVNLQLEISDEQRNKLARWIDNDETSRMAKREEVRDIIQTAFKGLLDAVGGTTTPVKNTPPKRGRRSKVPVRKRLGSFEVDNLLREKLKEKNLDEYKEKSYIRGWNQVANK